LALLTTARTTVARAGAGAAPCLETMSTYRGAEGDGSPCTSGVPCPAASRSPCSSAAVPCPQRRLLRDNPCSCATYSRRVDKSGLFFESLHCASRRPLPGASALLLRRVFVVVVVVT